jgi:flagellar hook-associated protein FlgK
LKTTLTDLTKTGINSGSASKLTSELKDIQAELTAIKGQSSGKFANQVSQLNTTITKISTDAKGLNSNPVGAIGKLTTDLNKLRTTAGPIISEINAACPK